MRQKIIKAFFLALFLTSASFPRNAFSDTLKPVLDAHGKPPKTYLVELPQESLKTWGKPFTLVILSGAPGMSPLNKDRFAAADALFKKKNWDALLSKDYPTAKGHPVTSFNYLWFAAKEGLVREVYWAAPSEKSTGSEPLDSFKDYLKSLGLDKEDLGSFVIDKKSIRGTLAGVPIRIYSLKDFPEVKGETLLLADPGFFKELYKDEVKTPFLDMFAGITNSLVSSGIHVSEAVISYSSSLSPITLKDRFIARYLYTYFSNPASLKNGPPASWGLRSEAMYNETFFQVEEAGQAYADAIKKDPDDPTLHYDMAMTMFSLKDLDGVRAEMGQAVRLDRNYYPGYLDLVNYFQSQKMFKDAEYFARAAAAANPDDPRCWDALYQTLYAQDKYAEALEALDNKIKLGFNDLSMRAAHAYILSKAGQYEKSAAEYEQVLKEIPPIDRQFRPGLLAELAGAYEGAGKIDKAIDLYYEAARSITDRAKRHELFERANELKENWKPFLSAPRKSP